MKAYLINMDSDTDRLAWMLSQVDKLPGELIRISAVNGKKLTEEQIRSNTSGPCAEFCTRSMIGCYLSHVKVWEEIIKNGDDMAIVLEDDAELIPNFSQELSKILKEFADKQQEFQYINLGVGVIDAIDVFADRGEFETVYKPIYSFLMHCYLITAKGAATLLKHSKAEWHVDMVVPKVLATDGMVLYASKKVLATQSTRFDSSQSADFPVLFSKLLNFDIVGTLNLHKMLATPIGAVKGITIDSYLLLFVILLLFRIKYVIIGVIGVWLLDIILFRKISSRILVYLTIAIILKFLQVKLQ